MPNVHHVFACVQCNCMSFFQIYRSDIDDMLKYALPKNKMCVYYWIQYTVLYVIAKSIIINFCFVFHLIYSVRENVWIYDIKLWEVCLLILFFFHWFSQEKHHSYIIYLSIDRWCHHHGPAIQRADNEVKNIIMIIKQKLWYSMLEFDNA